MRTICINMTTFVISGLLIILLNGCHQHGSNSKPIEHKDTMDSNSDSLERIDTDTMSVAEDNSKICSWQDIPESDDVKSINFEKWLDIMNYIRMNYWARPTEEMLSDVGLKALYEKDEMDEDSIKDVHFMYGRQTKCMTDSTGQKYHIFDDSHAVLFQVFAYTSSGAEIAFHNPSDMRDFIEQAIKRGVVASPNGKLIVCDKPIGKGLHKLKEVYDHKDTRKGAFEELYYLNPVYEPGADWQICYVTLDFLRHRIDVE